MLFDLLACGLLVAGVTFGPAWPLVVRWRLEPAEKLAASAALSLTIVFVVGWAVYVFGLPVRWYWLLPAASIGGLAAGWRALVVAWRDDASRDLILGQLLVTTWCVGWLATVVSYSGGGWAADWYEHWERVKFFVERGTTDALFLGYYPLTARPPLGNVVNAVLLSLTRADFAHYQFVSTLLGSLAFMPAALLAGRWGGRRAIPLLAVLFMVNPLFVQNATFAWTKLPTAFFVLAALYFFLRARERAASAAAVPVCAACLASGLLTHYSAGPYLVVLAVAWLVLGWSRRRDRNWWRATGGMAVVGTLVLAPWFGWALKVYGPAGTFLANSSVQGYAAVHDGWVTALVLNIRDTLVPHFLRTVDPALMAQQSAAGWWRDWFFQSYQVNLPLALGSVGGIVVARELVRAAKDAGRSESWFWMGFVSSVVLLGIVVHGTRDHWGLAHICLQPVALLGLAFLAARWASLPRGWKLAALVGAAADFSFGILLHFSVQSFAIDRWLGLQGALPQFVAHYNQSAGMNFGAKAMHHLAFLSDAMGTSPGIGGLALALVALLAFALVRSRAFPPDGHARSARSTASRF
jgi:4-amino-4-deoxy-L-arabinose transferase-like glycosyltransferase